MNIVLLLTFLFSPVNTHTGEEERCPSPKVRGGNLETKLEHVVHSGCRRHYGPAFCAVDVEIKPNKHYNVICGDRP